MFERQDYLDYFSEIEKIELNMVEEVYDIEKLIKNKKALKILDQIKEDEKRHYKYVREIIDLF